MASFADSRHRRGLPSQGFGTLQRLLLACGVFGPVVLFATDLFAGMARPGYNFVIQSASVLGAPGAPTRPVVVGLDLVADVLVMAFGVGVWISAGNRRTLRVIGGLLVMTVMLQMVALAFFPFHPGESTSGYANTMNVALMAPSIVGWFLAIAVGAVAFQSWFRFFSIALLVALLVEDVLTTAGASLFVSGGHPGSLVGIQERAMAYGFYVWMAVLALIQLRKGT
jgi:hypothetical protein